MQTQTPSLPSSLSVEEYTEFRQDTASFIEATNEIIWRHGLPSGELSPFPDGTNLVFALGKEHVIKIFPPFHQPQFENESLVLKHVEQKLRVKTPSLKYSGELNGWPYLVMTQLEGTILENVWETMKSENRFRLIGEIGALIKQVHSLRTEGLETLENSNWNTFIERQFKHCVEHHSTRLSKNLLLEIPSYLNEAITLFPDPKTISPVLLTGEYTPMNLLVKEDAGQWVLSGMFDFGDSMLGFREYDFLGPGTFLIRGNSRFLRELVTAYGYSKEHLNPTLSKRLMALMLLHRYSNLNIQIRIKNWQNTVRSLKDLENLVWSF